MPEQHSVTARKEAPRQHPTCIAWEGVRIEPMERKYTAVIQKRGRWYVAWVEEIPGVNTQGRTLAEARRNLREALQLVLEENRRLASKERHRSERREPIAVQA